MKVAFGILAHVDAGKTFFLEQILYKEQIIRTLGRVDAKNACMDHEDIEKARGIKPEFYTRRRFRIERCYRYSIFCRRKTRH